MHKKTSSDHFDGKRFFNPTLTRQIAPGFFDIFRMLREGRARWPREIKDCGVPRVHENLSGDDLALTFINHATFLIQFNGLNILTDPVWATYASPLSWAGPKRVRVCGIPLKELPRIDLILISHNHYDHFDTGTLRYLCKRFSPRIILPLGDRRLASPLGFTNIQEMDWWDDLRIGKDIRITFTPAQHSSARGLFDKDRSLWGGYYIQHGKKGVYFAGDSGYSSHFKEIRRRLGAPDLALLGIGAYLPSWFMRAIHTSPDEAVQAYLDLKAHLGIGMHYDTFQMSSEGYEQPIEDLKKALAQKQLDPGCFITLPEGETRIFR